jgi:hypothetical protein
LVLGVSWFRLANAFGVGFGALPVWAAASVFAGFCGDSHRPAGDLTLPFPGFVLQNRLTFF